MNIARIRNGIVINIEVADQEWIDANQGTDGCTFVEYTNEQPAHIGFGWTEANGFEQPPPDQLSPEAA